MIRLLMEMTFKLGICFLLIQIQSLCMLGSCHKIRSSRSTGNHDAIHEFQNLETGQFQDETFPSGGLPLTGLEIPLNLEVTEMKDEVGHLPFPDILPVEGEILPQLKKERSNFHVVDDCIMITMDEGVFHFKSRGVGETCGLYFVSDPDKVVLTSVEYLDVKCEDKGLISVVDGWELNGEIFPSPADHESPFASRFHDLCIDGQSRKLKKTAFISSQNAALIQYRVPAYGQGFSVRVRHVKNPKPCNVLVQDLEGIYKLENFGAERNCSITTLFDAKLKVLQMDVGVHSKPPKFLRRSFIPPEKFHKCGKLGLGDYVQIGGSSGLDSSKMEVIDEFCGLQSHPWGGHTTIFCGVTTVRMVSSGRFHNSLVLEVRRAGIEDLDSANFICGMEM